VTVSFGSVSVTVTVKICDGLIGTTVMPSFCEAVDGVAGVSAVEDGALGDGGAGAAVETDTSDVGAGTAVEDSGAVGTAGVLVDADDTEASGVEIEDAGAPVFDGGGTMVYIVTVTTGIGLISEGVETEDDAIAEEGVTWLANVASTADEGDGATGVG
jgi:hypothetical protein